MRSLRSLASLSVCLLLLVAGQALLWWLYAGPRATSFDALTPPVMLPLEGFYPAEQPADAAPYRWTTGSASMGLPNPGGATQLAVTLAGGPGRSVPVTVTVGAHAARFAVTPEPRRYTLMLPSQPGRRVAVELAAPTLQGSDRRALGVVWYGARIVGGGQAPLGLALCVALGTLGAWALLQQAGYGLGASGLLVGGAQAALLLWQARWGWRYGLAEPLLALIGLGGLIAVAVERYLLPPTRAPLPFPRPQTAQRHHGGDGILVTFPSGGQSGWWHWGTTRLRAYVVLGGVLLVAMALRLPFIGAPDPVGDLELSARRIGFLLRDGLAGAYVADGDYMPLRLYLLWGFSLIAQALDLSLYPPLPTATKALLKLPALLGDAILLAVLFFWSLRWRNLWGAGALAALYAVTPPVWVNVAWWGQVDGLLILPMVAAVVLLGQGSGRRAWACWALALLLKPQPVLLAPLMVAATLRRHGCRGLVQGGAVAASLFVLALIPLALAGQGPGVFQAYAGSVGRFPLLSNDAYNLWYLVGQGRNIADTDLLLGPLSYRAVGLLLLGIVAALVGFALLRRADGATRVLAAAVLALAFFCLPTQIHQRYLFLTFAFLALRLASDARLLFLYLLLAITGTLNVVGSLEFLPQLRPLVAQGWLPYLCAILNLLTLALLLGALVRAAWQQQHALTPPADAPERYAERAQL